MEGSLMTFASVGDLAVYYQANIVPNEKLKLASHIVIGVKLYNYTSTVRIACSSYNESLREGLVIRTKLNANVKYVLRLKYSKHFMYHIINKHLINLFNAP